MQQLPSLTEPADLGRVRGQLLGHPLAGSAAGQQAPAAGFRARHLVDLAAAGPSQPLAVSSYPLPVQGEQGWPQSSVFQQALGGQPGASALLPGAWRPCPAQAHAAREDLARSQGIARGVQRRSEAAMLPHPFAAAAATGPAWGVHSGQWAARPKHLSGREDCPPQSAASSCSEPSPPSSLATSMRKRGRADWTDDISQRARLHQGAAAAAALPVGAMGQQPLPSMRPPGYCAQTQIMQLPGLGSQHKKLELAVAQLRPHPAELAWACRTYVDLYQRKQRGEPRAKLPKSALLLLQAQLLCIYTERSLQQHGSGRSEQMVLGPYS